ncbi:MAG: D-aminoacylase [Chloroflexi bacterium]|nr:D-aminoacylase [Chloroflexota bacterium]
MYDIVIRGARIVDGAGNPWYRGGVAIRDGRIVAVGEVPAGDARQVIDAGDRVVCPGFIDSHVHADLVLLADPEFPGGLYQGVTTHIIGQDGVSYAPASTQTQAFYRKYFAAINTDPAGIGGWRSVGEYLARFDGASTANVAYLVPHGTVRIEVMGLADRAPTADELRAMQKLVAEGMADGAVGFSTGLDYIPCTYADTNELIELCRPAAAAGGVYVTHMRSYLPATVAESVEEVLAIGRAAGLPVHISHYNGMADQLLPLIDNGRSRGYDITFDTYPYLAGCTILAMVALPRWVQVGGIEATVERLRAAETREKLRDWFATPTYGYEYLQLAGVVDPSDKELEGLTIEVAAAKRGQTPGDFICDLLVRNNMIVLVIALHSWRGDNDVERIMSHPAHMAGSDGIYFGGKPHPRGFGSFARFLGLYVREKDVMPLEEMVRHMTSAAAQRWRLKDRGLLREGYAADVVVFDPQTIRDHATYADGRQFAEGVSHVIVNGTAVLAGGKPTGARSGRGLKRQ